MIERVEDHDKVNRCLDFAKLLMISAQKAAFLVTKFDRSGVVHLHYEFDFQIPEQAYSDCTEIHLTNVMKGMEAVPHVF